MVVWNFARIRKRRGKLKLESGNNVRYNKYTWISYGKNVVNTGSITYLTLLHTVTNIAWRSRSEESTLLFHICLMRVWYTLNPPFVEKKMEAPTFSNLVHVSLYHAKLTPKERGQTLGTAKDFSPLVMALTFGCNDDETGIYARTEHNIFYFCDTCNFIYFWHLLQAEVMLDGLGFLRYFKEN